MKVVRFLSPAALLLVPALVSFAVWSIPGEGLFLRGFDTRSDLTFGSATILILWYGSCALCASFGVALGRSLVPARSYTTDEDVFDQKFGITLSVISIVGVVSTYVEIARNVSIVEMLSGSNANLLTAGVLGGAGISTLRYAAMLSAPVAVHRALKGAGSWLFASLNVMLLLAVSVLSSRLSLMMASFVLLLLSVRRKSIVRFRVRNVIMASVALFGGLTFLNYTRNQHFYEQFGVSNPIFMNLYQIAAYLGAPSQVSIGVANAIASKGFVVKSDPWGALGAIVPTFLQSEKSDKSEAVDPGLYGYSVDIAPNLNANSAFADTFAQFGWWGLLYVMMAVLFAAVLFGRFVRSRSAVAVFAGIAGYGFLEFWRISLFNQGFMYFLLLSGVLAALIARRGGMRASAPSPSSTYKTGAALPRAERFDG